MTHIKIDCEHGEVTKDGQTLRFNFQKPPEVRVLVWYPDEGRGKLETMDGKNTSFEDFTQFQTIVDAFETERAKPLPQPTPIEDLPISAYDERSLAAVVERLAKQAGLADEAGKVKKDKTSNAP